MIKDDLIKILNEIFIPLDFKKKGNNWVLNSEVLSKIINLQKSNYGNFFYINYGYIINGVELTTATHIGNRLASMDKNEQKRITDLLDLESEIPDDTRQSELREFIYEKIVSQVQSMNTEEDILNDLKKRPHLNNIPGTVKRHFNLI